MRVSCALTADMTDEDLIIHYILQAKEAMFCSLSLSLYRYRCRLVFSHLLALLVCISAAFLAVMKRESLSPGLAGLVLSFTLQVCVKRLTSFPFR